MISKDMLLEIGKKKGLFNKEYIEKNYFQEVFLFNLFKKTNKLIFKGGTALYKIYNLPRFSEDLDFSLLEDLDLAYIEDLVKDVAKKSEFLELKSTKKTKDSFLIKLICKGILTKSNSLRIDINFKNKILRGFDVKNYVPEYIDIPPFSLRILKLEEIISEKVHSLLMREKARDLFDLFFLLRIGNLDEKLIKEKLEIFNLRYDKNILLKKINNLQNIWKPELKPFVLADLPEFSVVRDYVFSKFSI